VKQSSDDGDAVWVTISGQNSGGYTVLQMTTIINGEPQLVWTPDNEAILTEVPL
jgi:hypothetical protein